MARLLAEHSRGKEVRMSKVETETLYWDRVPVFYIAEPGYYVEEEVGDAIRSLMETRPGAIESLPRGDSRITLFETGPGGEKFAGIFAGGAPIAFREREGVLAEAESYELTKVLLNRVADLIEAWAAESSGPARS
jgi:hypothetical protein